MEEDILNFSPTGMFRGTPCMINEYDVCYRGVFAKNERADIEMNSISIASNFTFICCVYKEKMVKKRYISKSYRTQTNLELYYLAFRTNFVRIYNFPSVDL